MSDDLKKFLKKHDVQMEAPPGEWTRLKSRLSDKKTHGFVGFLPRSWAFGLATLGVAVLAVVGYQNRPTSMVERTSDVPAALSSEEAAEFLQETFADLEEENDFEDDSEFDL